MSKIKIEIEIDTLEHSHALPALVKLLEGLSPLGEKKCSPCKDSEAEEVDEPVKSTKKKQPAAQKTKSEDIKIEEPKVEESEEPKTEESSDIDIDSLRLSLGKKVGEHREAIKAKLTELGAANLSALANEHYEEFSEFLNNL